MIIDKYKQFLDKLFATLNENNIEVSEYVLDHIAYYVSSSEEYDQLKLKFVNLGEEVKESVVGGRRVYIVKLNKPLLYKNYSIDGIELVEPKEGQIIESDFEHAEFVVSNLKSILDKYPDINWDTGAMDRDEYPKVQYKFENGVGIKFHPEHIFDEAKSY